MSRRLIVLLCFACGCAAGAPLCPQRHAVVRQSAMSCAELNQVAAGAVKRMGYNIDSFSPAAAEQPGKLEGSRRDYSDNTYRIVVELQCSASESVADAVSTVGCASQINFPNDFQQNFRASIARKKAQTAASLASDEQSGVRISIEPQRDADKALGVALSAADLMPVKVRIDNRTARAYRLEQGAISLVSEAGARVEGISAAEAAKRVARATPAEAASAEERLHRQGLQPGGIEANQTIEGYLFVPRQAYRKATVRLIDQEAEEPEGFTIEF
jgi:hypothetical protein